MISRECAGDQGAQGISRGGRSVSEGIKGFCRVRSGESAASPEVGKAGDRKEAFFFFFLRNLLKMEAS